MHPQRVVLAHPQNLADSNFPPFYLVQVQVWKTKSGHIMLVIWDRNICSSMWMFPRGLFIFTETDRHLTYFMANRGRHMKNSQWPFLANGLSFWRVNWYTCRPKSGDSADQVVHRSDSWFCHQGAQVWKMTTGHITLVLRDKSLCSCMWMSPDGSIIFTESDRHLTYFMANRGRFVQNTKMALLGPARKPMMLSLRKQDHAIILGLGNNF